MLIGNSLPMGRADQLRRVIRSNCDTFCTEFSLSFLGAVFLDACVHGSERHRDARRSLHSLD